MRKFLESLFFRKSTDPGDGAQSEPRGDSTSAAGDLTVEEILADLVAHVCATMPDPRPAEEIDTRIHMYDAGYVTSISAADLLAHIDARYGLDISETKLIGPLQNLEALARHIDSTPS